VLGVIVERSTLLFLRRVRVVKRHVHLRMAHDRLNDCRVRLFVHQKTGEAVPPQIVKPEAAQAISFLAEQFTLPEFMQRRRSRNAPSSRSTPGLVLPIPRPTLFTNILRGRIFLAWWTDDA